MRKKVILLLESDVSITKCLIIEDKNQTRYLNQCNIDEIYSLSLNSDVYILVPGRSVLLSNVKIPKLSQRRLMKAIPYLLEEELSGDISNMHFAIGKLINENFYSVAVVAKEKMEAWISLLSRFIDNPKISIKGLMPENLALPWKTDEWTVLIDEEQALVRTGNQSGFAINKMELWTILHLLIKQNTLTIPKEIRLIGKINLTDEEKSFWNEYNVIIKQEHNDAKLFLMSNIIDKNMPINLLQGQFKSRSKFLNASLLNKTAALLTFLCVLTLSFGSLLQISILNKHDHKLQQLIKIVMNQNFPKNHISTPHEVKPYLKRIVKQLQDTHIESQFILIMKSISPLISQAKNVKVLGLDYDKNQLTLQLEASDFLALEQLSQSLKAIKLKVKQSEEKKSDGSIHSTFLISNIS